MINYLWFRKNIFSLFLFPFTFIYWLVSSNRRRCYLNGDYPSYKSKVPVVVIGNIMVGGNGKTPVVIELAKYLQQKGLRVGIVSRGYRAQPKKLPYEVLDDSNVLEAGDEPLLIKRKTGARVVIDPIRVRAVKSIENEVDVILTDDGLQHYALQRNIEILVIDGKRRFGNGWLMPMGPLREGLWRLNTVDFKICNGGEAQPFEVRMDLAVNDIYNANDKYHNTLQPNSKVCVLAGIGDPSRVYKTVESLGFSIAATIKADDHKFVNISDIKNSKYPVIMTEKDYVKYNCLDFDDRVFVLPVTAVLEKSFYGIFYAKLRTFLHKDESIL